MTRRMTLLVLAIVGLMVLVVTVTPPRTAQRGGSETATPAADTVLSAPNDFDVSATLSADAEGEPQTIEAELGDDVEIIVEGTGPGWVALAGLRSALFDDGLPARMELLAETPGAYPLLVDDERQIGTLMIR